MSNVTRRALRVYAALSEFKGENEDILDALIPFFEPVLEVMNGKFFDTKLFAVGVQRLYHWRFTQDIAESFVPRLERKGYLRHGGGTRNKPIYVVTFESHLDASNELPITQVLNKIIDEFEQFPPKLTDLFNYKRTRDELTDILIRFLVSLDAYRDNTIQVELERALDKDEKTLLSQIEEGGTPLQHDDRYIAARFVQYLCKRYPDYVPHLSRLASIGLLTEVVQDFVKPLQPETKVHLTVVVDAPLALDYLGCSGRELKADVNSIFDSLKKIGCSFVVFPVSCREMQRNLNSMFALQGPMRHGYTHEAMLKREVLEEYVRAVAYDPEVKLEAAGIQVKALALDQYPNSHVYFDADRYEDFYSYVDWVVDVAPRNHDAACMALVMRLREGKHHSDLFRCGYLFVTRNPSFARKSRAYCIDNRLITSVQTGPVITQRELAVAAWLRTGLGADDSLPRAHLLGVCDRVLRVRPEVRDAVASTLSSVTPDLLPQFEALLLDQRSVRKLADETFNNEAIVSPENAMQLLEAMKQATVEEEKQRFGEEIETLKSKHAQRDREAVQQTAKIAAKLDAARFALERVRDRDKKSFVGAIVRINSILKTLEIVILLLLLALVVAGIVDFATGSLSTFKSWALVPLAAFVASTYHMLMDVMGWPKVGVVTLLNWFGRSLLNRKLAVLGLSPQFSSEDVEIARGRLREKLSVEPALLDDRSDELRF